MVWFLFFYYIQIMRNCNALLCCWKFRGISNKKMPLNYCIRLKAVCTTADSFGSDMAVLAATFTCWMYTVYRRFIVIFHFIEIANRRLLDCRCSALSGLASVLDHTMQIRCRTGWTGWENLPGLCRQRSSAGFVLVYPFRLSPPVPQEPRGK